MGDYPDVPDHIYWREGNVYLFEGNRRVLVARLTEGDRHDWWLVDDKGLKRNGWNGSIVPTGASKRIDYVLVSIKMTPRESIYG